MLSRMFEAVEWAGLLTFFFCTSRTAGFFLVEGIVVPDQGSAGVHGLQFPRNLTTGQG